jgi:hypothetical protein
MPLLAHDPRVFRKKYKRITTLLLIFLQINKSCQVNTFMLIIFVGSFFCASCAYEVLIDGAMRNWGQSITYVSLLCSSLNFSRVTTN